MLAYAGLAQAKADTSSTSLDPTVFAVVQAEAIPLATGKGKIVRDRAVSSKRAIELRRKTALTVGIDGQISSVTLRLRPRDCAGSPRIRVRVNGVIVSTRKVKRNRWKNYRATVPSSPGGKYQVSVAFANPKATKRCTRALRVDWIGARSRWSGAPPKIETLGEGPDTVAVYDQSQFRPDSPQATGAVNSANLNSAKPAPTPAPAPAPAPSQLDAPFGTSISPIVARTPSGISRLYVKPDSKAEQLADAWRSSRPSDARQMDKLASSATATWLGGWTNELAGLSSTLKAAAADRARTIITIYGIPKRDSGQYSAGGHASSDDYKSWIDSVAKTIGKSSTLIVVEPDAAATMLPTADQQERFALLSYATAKLGALPDSLVYLDAGNGGWRSVSDIVWRLKASGIANADGFASNTSNFRWTADEIAWGKQVSAALGGKHMVIDTSRNGRGPNPGASGEAVWCNPPGRGIGSRSTMASGVAGVDALIWVKIPGASDGSCFGHAPAGTYEPEVALQLAKNGTW